MEDCSTDERLQQETFCRWQWTDEYVERPETLMRQNVVVVWLQCLLVDIVRHTRSTVPDRVDMCTPKQRHYRWSVQKPSTSSEVGNVIRDCRGTEAVNYELRMTVSQRTRTVLGRRAFRVCDLRRGTPCRQNCVLLLCVLTLSANNWKLACSRALTDSALDDILDCLFCAIQMRVLIDWLQTGSSFLDQELILYRFSSCCSSSCWGDMTS